MEKAAFKLDNYRFTKAYLDLGNVSRNLEIDIHPEGNFNKEENSFLLTLVFKIMNDNQESNDYQKVFVTVECESVFCFEKKLNSKEEIPDYFYTNSIAIIFPYIRAFISTLTLQSNNKPIVLPTMNLSSLKEDLMKNTREA